MLLDVDEDNTEFVAGADSNGAEAPMEKQTPEEHVHQAIVEKCAKKLETTTIDGVESCDD